MEPLQILILAIIQGVTEWLPISSSGHLVIMQQYFGLEVPLIFDVSLHVGTLCVVVVFFRRSIREIIEALRRRDFASEEGRLALYVGLGSVPIALIGFFFHDFFQFLFTSTLAVGVALLITGFILYCSRLQQNGKGLNYLESLLICLTQGFALAPGISRSGVTLSAGILSKVDKEIAFRYSFLLSIPAIIGATVMEFNDLVASQMDVGALLFGVIVSMVVGYGSLSLLRKVVLKEKLHLFAYYCWIAGLVTIAFST